MTECVLSAPQIKAFLSCRCSCSTETDPFEYWPRQISWLSHIVCMIVAEVDNSRIMICLLLRGLQHELCLICLINDYRTLRVDL
jgi:hypothetical protein